MNHGDGARGESEGLERQGAFAERDDWSASGWCRIERSFDVIGTRSAIFVIRELFYGGTKFDELVRRTELSEAVVAGRLKDLYAEGIVDRRPYQEAGKRTRDEYVLTERGRALFPVVVALARWGDGLRDDQRTGVELVHRECGAPLSAAVMCENGHEVSVDGAAVRLKDEGYAVAGRRRRQK